MSMKILKRLSCFLEWGQAPKPPGFVALARHYAFRQAEPVNNPAQSAKNVTTRSIEHLFNCCSSFVQMHLFSGYLINQIFVQLSTCSIDFLFNRFLFSWFFVQWFCSNDLCSIPFVQQSDHPHIMPPRMFVHVINFQRIIIR